MKETTRLCEDEIDILSDRFLGIEDDGKISGLSSFSNAIADSVVEGLRDRILSDSDIERLGELLGCEITAATLFTRVFDRLEQKA